MDLDLTNLENFYENAGAGHQKSTHKFKQRESHRKLKKKKTETLALNAKESDKVGNANSIILSGRYIDCGVSSQKKEARSLNRRRQVSNDIHENDKDDDDSILSDRKNQFMASKGSLYS